MLPGDAAPPWANLTTVATRNIEQDETRHIDARGWPCVTLWCEYVETTPTQYGGFQHEAVGAIGLPLAPRDWAGIGLDFYERALPLRPIWPAFAVNTILYGAILSLLIPGPFALRRFLRVRRGLCPKCAYPVGESSVCTECGGALPKPAVA